MLVLVTVNMVFFLDVVIREVGRVRDVRTVRDVRASMLGQLPFERVKVIFGCANDKFGGGGTCLSVHEMRGLPSCLQSDTADDGSSSSSKAYECVGGLFKDEAIELFQRFYVRGNPKAPVPHREVREYPS